MKAKAILISRLKAFIFGIYIMPHTLKERLDSRLKRRRCIVSDGTKLYLPCQINNRQPRSAIRFGKDAKVMAKFETYRYGGRIEVGNYCFIGENTYIWSAASIKIGDRVLISHSVNIHDTNSHSLSAENRHNHFIDIFHNSSRGDTPDITSAPIVIEDDAWIGFGSAIFKGVTIGQGAVVAAMSVVTKDVPPFTIVAGNPAKPVGTSRP